MSVVREEILSRRAAKRLQVNVCASIDEAKTNLLPEILTPPRLKYQASSLQLLDARASSRLIP